MSGDRQFEHIKELMEVPDGETASKELSLFPAIITNLDTCLYIHKKTNTDKHDKFAFHFQGKVYGTFYGKAIVTAHEDDYYGPPHSSDLLNIRTALRFFPRCDEVANETKQPPAKKAKVSKPATGGVVVGTQPARKGKTTATAACDRV